MAEAAADLVDKATVAAQVAARPNVLITIFALAALFGCGFLVWRDEVRADAQIGVLQAMQAEISGLRGDFQAAGIKVSRRATAAAVAP